MKTVVGLAILLVASACTSTPDNQNHLVELGNEYAKDGLLREAAATYRKVLRQNPKEALARRNLGIVLVKSGAYKAAIYNFEQIIGQLDNDYETNFYLAEAYRANQKFAEAIYRYQKALRKKPRSLRSLKGLAWSNYKIRYYEEAIQIARRMHKLNKNDPQVAIILARTLLKLRRYKRALVIIKRGRRNARAENKPYFDSVHGDILTETGKYKEAIEIYRDALKVQPLLAGSLLGLGKCFLKLGKVEHGATYILRAVRIRPDLPEAYYLLAIANEESDPQKALRYYRKFRKLAGKDPEFMNQMAGIKTKIKQLRASRNANDR